MNRAKRISVLTVLTVGLAGLLLIVSQIFSVAANLFGGYFADRFGRKRMLVSRWGWAWYRLL